MAVGLRRLREACKEARFHGAPGFALGTHADAGEPHVFRELQIRFAVADHVGVLSIHGAPAKVLLHEPGAGLSAGAAVARHVRADEDLVELRALAFENLHHEVVRTLKGFSREG